MVDPVSRGEPEEQARFGFAPAAVVLYTMLTAAGVLWLWLRDRLAVLPKAPAGEHGLLVSLAVGTAVGLGCSALFALAARHVGAFRRLEERLGALIGPVGEREIIVLAVFSAVGEEFFFRLAMQDAFGLYSTAAVFGLLHVGPRGTRLWTLMAVLLGLGFGQMIAAGLGLMSVTVAHALINYLSLGRMNRA
jgi:membrane protease YdiL (CAAX protease family)